MIEKRKKKQETRYLVLFFLIGYVSFAQTKGVVKDSLSGNPIPYVSVWVENENIGTTSEENGEFVINVSDTNKNLVFSALGFETKIVPVLNLDKILLKPISFDLQEVVISNKKSTKTITIGDYSKKEIKHGLTNSGQENVFIWGKIIPSNSKIEEHPFLKSIEFHTRSHVKNSLLRIRFFSMDKSKNSTGDIILENILVSVKKGKQKNSVDLSNYDIKIPKEGMIIGFEYLRLEQNLYKFSYSEYNSTKILEGFKYEPAILGSFNESSNAVLLNKEGIAEKSPVEIALKLTLTN